MHQIVYISTCRTEVSPELLRDILSVSQINNERVGVTGLLVNGGTRFLQVLEGPVAMVSNTYERIKRDPRHFACVVLTSRSINARQFGSWSMAFQQASAAPDGSLQEIVHALTEGLTDLGLQAEFRGFADLHSRAA